MRKDAAEVHARTHRLVQSIGVQGNQPIGFECQSQRLTNGIFYAHIGVDSKERLFVEHGKRLGLPVVLVTLEHKKRGLHAAAERGADVWDELAMVPEAVGKHTGPEEFVMTTTHGTFFNRRGREITLEACAEMVCKVQFGTATDTEGGTTDFQPKRIVATILIATMHHHTAREALDKLVLLGKRPHYPTGRQKNGND